VGATYNGKPVGSFGDISTASFYPAHHITMGEGGCVLVQSGAMKKMLNHSATGAVIVGAQLAKTTHAGVGLIGNWAICR
jgi:dTDP-4-amino-4,6-dideoxygalactose transaminase